MIATKPPRCKHCRLRTDDVRQRIHPACVEPWLESEKTKKASIKVKVDRALLREYREKRKTIAGRIAEAQTQFNLYIRLRDRGHPCICCAQALIAGEVGGLYDCGHYRSTGSASHLRFNENNAHGQRKYCNRHRGGRAVDYRIGLIERIGLQAVEALEADNTVHKWTHAELIEIKRVYRAKAKALKQRMEA